MSTYEGRGAWSPIGGTLRKVSGVTVPGPYYMRPTKGVAVVGDAADVVLDAGGVPDLNEHAVWFGVLALKTRLYEVTGISMTMDGRYGTGIRDAVVAFQSLHGLSADGVVGPGTARALFSPVVTEVGTWSAIGSRIGCGVVTNESGWDPGAVGKVDSEDHGLCQLNAVSQKFTLEQSFTVRTALFRLFGILDNNLITFGNEADAIAAYNLGSAGCRLWIKEGRPQWFIPLSQRDDPNAKPRDVHAYIERIKTAC